MALQARSDEPAIAEIQFAIPTEGRITTNAVPAWIRGISKSDGEITGQPARWHVPASSGVGVGRLVIDLDRDLMQEDVALTVLFQVAAHSDLVVQLFDSHDRVILLDLFANLMVVGPEAKTDTFIVPLRSYPAATKIVLRRIKGEVTVYGLALYPVVVEAEADPEALKKLAALLGDPLSADSPLAKAVRKFARTQDLSWDNERSVSNRPPSASGRVDRFKTTSANSSLFWEVLPWPRNSDWPGGRGAPTVVGRNELLFRGQSVRSSKSFSLPITIDLDFKLGANPVPDGGLVLTLVPASTPAELQGDDVRAFVVSYRSPTATSVDGQSALVLFSTEDGTTRIIETPHPMEIAVGKTYRLHCTIQDGFAEFSVGDKRIISKRAPIPQQPFRVQISGWKPENEWLVENVNIR